MLAPADYADGVMTRYIVENGAIRDDLLNRAQLKGWADGLDPLTWERRGYNLESPNADLILDATINAGYLTAERVAHVASLCNSDADLVVFLAVTGLRWARRRPCASRRSTSTGCGSPPTNPAPSSRLSSMRRRMA